MPILCAISALSIVAQALYDGQNVQAIQYYSDKPEYAVRECHHDRSSRSAHTLESHGRAKL